MVQSFTGNLCIAGLHSPFHPCGRQDNHSGSRSTLVGQAHPNMFGDEVNTIVIAGHLKKKKVGGGSIILLQAATAVRECCCHDRVTRSAAVQVIMSTRMAGPKASQLNITQSVTLPPPAFFMTVVHPQLSKSFKSMQVCNS